LSLAKDATPSATVNTQGAELKIGVLIDEERFDAFKESLQKSIIGLAFKNVECTFERHSEVNALVGTKISALESTTYVVNDGGKQYAEFKRQLQAKFGIEIVDGQCSYKAHTVPLDLDTAELGVGLVQRLCREFYCNEICVLPCDDEQTMIFFNTDPPKALVTKIGGTEVEILLDSLQKLSPAGVASGDGAHHFRIMQ
jgi:hypothetical protein